MYRDYGRSGRIRKPSLMRSLLEFFRPAPKRIPPHLLVRSHASLATQRVQSEQCARSAPIMEALQDMLQNRVGTAAHSDGRVPLVMREIELSRGSKP